MSEIEQLRKEVNELRERIADLERYNGRTAHGDMMNMRIGGPESRKRFISRDPGGVFSSANKVFSTTER